MSFPDLHDLKAARAVIARSLTPSAQICWPLLSARIDGEVWVKHENHLPTGAFKIRGGLVHLDRLLTESPGLRGVISATRGNHGQSLALAGRQLGLPVTILVPEGNSAEKNAAMRAYGAELIEHGADFEAAKAEAERLAAERGLHMVSSFHPDLVCGVATWAQELFSAAPPLERLYVPIGLGSGICGAILARDLMDLPTEIIGVQAEGAPAYALSFAAGERVSTPRSDTFADGIATRDPHPDALRIILEGAARIVTVSDAEIAAAIRVYWTDTHNLAEGAGAAGLAALMAEAGQNAGRRVATVLSGGNIDFDLFRRVTGS